MIYGKGKARFTIKNSVGTTIDTINITQTIERKHTWIRETQAYLNPFTRRKVDKFLGYRPVFEFTVFTSDSELSLADYGQDQEIGTPNDVYKLMKTQDYYDQGYLIYYAPHIDAMNEPYAQEFLVDCEIVDMGSDSVYNDTWRMKCQAVVLYDSMLVDYSVGVTADQTTWKADSTLITADAI